MRPGSRTIQIRMNDAELEQLDSLRGKETRSGYLKRKAGLLTSDPSGGSVSAFKGSPAPEPKKSLTQPVATNGAVAVATEKGVATTTVATKPPTVVTGVATKKPVPLWCKEHGTWLKRCKH